MDLPVTGAHGFCFLGDEIIVCDVAGRGLSIPGGHVEAGESPRDCFIREVREEAAAELENVRLLGHIVTDHSVNPSYQGKYPCRAAQAMFVASITRLDEFAPSVDSTARRLVPFDALPSIHHQWHDVLEAAYVDAIAAAGPNKRIQWTKGRA